MIECLSKTYLNWECTVIKFIRFLKKVE